MPLLISLKIVPNGEFGLGNPIFSAPSIDHWCGTDRLGRDVCIRTLAASGVALQVVFVAVSLACLLYTSPSPRDRTRSRMPSSA